MKWFSRVVCLLLICCLLASADLAASTLTKKRITGPHFDCPSITYENEKVVMPGCGKTDGSISGLTIHSDGTKITYAWHDGTNAIVGHNLNLPTVGEGVYRLEITDNSSCSNSVFSKPFVLAGANAITLYDDDPVVGSATCTTGGSIKGIKVVNASSYSWKDISGREYTSTTTADLLNATAGSYTLTAANSSGCIAVSKRITIPMQVNFDVPSVTSYSITNGSCTVADSLIINLSVEQGGPTLTRFFILANDPAQLHLNEGLIFTDRPTLKVGLKNVDQGTYNFYVQLNDGCPALLGTYTIGYDDPSIDMAKSFVANDRCGQHIGGITPVTVGLAPKATYTWIDLKTGKTISNYKTLFRVGEGRYQFTARNSPACKATAVFTLLNDSPPLPPPIIDGATLCLPGIASLKIKDHVDTTDIFKLYLSEQDTIAVDSNKFGEFYRKVSVTTDFYVSRKRFDCESERIKVTEVVIASIDFGNTFTPNNDGVNDVWKITGIEAFPDADVKVFDRYGHTVYSSKGYGMPFDGRSRGRLLPTGVYYYAIDLKKRACYGEIAGSLTILH